MKKILIIASHPDDEVLGCGATIAKLSKIGYEIFAIILSKGKTSRDLISKKELEILNQETHNSSKILGIKELINFDLPDNKFDSIPLIEIIKKIESVKKEIRPEIIFTHHFGDLNIDHQITYKAVITATRPMTNESVKEIYSFEVPSSTEWGGFDKNNYFIPNVFIDVSDTIDIKIKAMAEYKSELREYPHPRSLQYIKDLAKINGARVGLQYSENFYLVRSLRNIT
jgi:LmbE family N-acetylglucosaminyl deacetylase